MNIPYLKNADWLDAFGQYLDGVFTNYIKLTLDNNCPNSQSNWNKPKPEVN